MEALAQWEKWGPLNYKIYKETYFLLQIMALMFQFKAKWNVLNNYTVESSKLSSKYNKNIGLQTTVVLYRQYSMIYKMKYGLTDRLSVTNTSTELTVTIHNDLFLHLAELNVSITAEKSNSWSTSLSMFKRDRLFIFSWVCVDLRADL